MIEDFDAHAFAVRRLEGAEDNVTYNEIDLAKVKTYMGADRASKVSTALEASPPRAGMTFSAFLKTLPKILKANESQRCRRRRGQRQAA